MQTMVLPNCVCKKNICRGGVRARALGPPRPKGAGAGPFLSRLAERARSAKKIFCFFDPLTARIASSGCPERGGKVETRRVGPGPRPGPGPYTEIGFYVWGPYTQIGFDV